MPRKTGPNKTPAQKTAARADRVRNEQGKLSSSFERFLHCITTADTTYLAKNAAAVSDGLTAEDCVRLEAVVAAFCATGAMDSTRAAAVSRILTGIREHRISTLQQVLAPSCVLIPYVAGDASWETHKVIEEPAEEPAPLRAVQ